MRMMKGKRLVLSGDVRRFARPVIFAAAFLGGVFPSAAVDKDPIVNISPKTFSTQNIMFLPGVFHVDEASNSIKALCIPVNGRWLQVKEELTPCPLDPGASKPRKELTYQLAANHGASPDLTVANLGIDAEQWRRGGNGRATSGEEILKKISRAVEIADGDKYIEWRFRSREFPPMLRNEIPGSGIFFNLGQQFALDLPPVTGPDGHALHVEASVGMPDCVTTGGAATTLTLGVLLQSTDANGVVAPIQLVVALYGSRGTGNERVGSDGRNQFAATSLSADSRFLVWNGSQTTPRFCGGHADIAFDLTTRTLGALIQAVNLARAHKGMSSINDDPSRIRLKRLDLRNENRFLDKGEVDVTVNVDWLRAYKVGS